MKTPFWAAVVLATGSPLVAVGGTGRVRHVEGSVSIQRSGQSISEEVHSNIPFLPGDRLFASQSGRVELQFGPSLVRVDSRSSLELFSESAFRLNGGGLYIHAARGNAVFSVDTSGGHIEIHDSGVYRLDVESGETRLSVLQGRATLDPGTGALLVQAGQRVYAREGAPPEGPQGFAALDDDFARFDKSLDTSADFGNGESRRHVPEELAPYSRELDSNGTWSTEDDAGYVWRPYVGADWSPYVDGQWGWTTFGWTWYPNELWGWAPFHYGRWGFSGGLGWYWVPGPVWGPAWVSWSFGGGLVGWSPLGVHGRSVFAPGFGYANTWGRGYAVPRGTAGGWNYVRAGDLSAHNLARLRVNPTPAQVRALQVGGSSLQQPNRTFTAWHDVPTRAVARKGPTIGDSVPALRRDWNLPPVPGTAGAPEGPPYSRRGQSTHSRDVRPSRGYSSNLTTGSSSAPRKDHPTDHRSPETLPNYRPATTRSEPRYVGSQGDGGREVLRPFFQPLRENHDENRPPPRQEQREARPPSPPRTQSRPPSTPRAQSHPPHPSGGAQHRDHR